MESFQAGELFSIKKWVVDYGLDFNYSIIFGHSPSGIGRGVAWSRDLGISRAGEGMDEVFSMRGKGDSLLLETLAAVLPSRD